jgi:hypothetical protein
MAANGDTRESDFGNQTTGGADGINHLSPNETRDSALHKIKTAGSISIPPELFEKLYLTPQNEVKGDLRKILGNPTPL